MIFEIDRIPEDRMDFQLELEPGQLEIENSDCVLCEAVAVKGSLAKIKKDVYLNGEVSTALRLTCTRCLAPVTYPVNYKLSARYVSQDKARELGRDLELEESDIEIEYYSENKIDISPLVQDQILLAIPMRCLCKQDCLGLCDRCGQDLNMSPCGCGPDQTVDPRLEKLKLLKETV